MRAWIFLLSIWILVCAGMPCSDLLGEAGGPVLKKEAVQKIATEQDHEHSTDACSPFCSCYCCAVISMLPKPVGYFSKPVLLGVPETRYLYPPAQELPYSFWQPPRTA